MHKLIYNILYVLIVLFNVRLLIDTFTQSVICYILIMLLFSLMLYGLNELDSYFSKNKRK